MTELLSAASTVLTSGILLAWLLMALYRSGVRTGCEDHRARMVHWLHIRKIVSATEGDHAASRVIGELAVLLATKEDDATAKIGIPDDEDSNVVELHKSTFRGA